jgi:hypothetical protein
MTEISEESKEILTKEEIDFILADLIKEERGMNK